MELDRRLNVLIYLNKDWEEIWGPPSIMGQRYEKLQKYLPKFNSMIVFGTTDFSNHGHPDALICLILGQENLLQLIIIQMEDQKKKL